MSTATWGVAADEISSLRAEREPLVLRVEAPGREPPGPAALVGDWLCEADGSAPRRLPKPNWYFNGYAKAWASRGWLDAWETCRNAMWMAWGLADVAGFDPGLVAAASACASALLGPAAGGPYDEGLVRQATSWARAAEEGIGDPRHVWHCFSAAAEAMAGGSGRAVAPDTATFAAVAAGMADDLRRRVPTIRVLRAALRKDEERRERLSRPLFNWKAKG